MQFQTAISIVILCCSASAIAKPDPAPARAPQSSGATQCRSTEAHEAAKRGASRSFRRLGELPAANAYKAVYHVVDGCEVPIMVKYDVGRR